jgi:hypothetical protein
METPNASAKARRDRNPKRRRVVFSSLGVMLILSDERIKIRSSFRIKPLLTLLRVKKHIPEPFPALIIAPLQLIGVNGVSEFLQRAERMLATVKLRKIPVCIGNAREVCFHLPVLLSFLIIRYHSVIGLSREKCMGREKNFGKGVKYIIPKIMILSDRSSLPETALTTGPPAG